MLGRWVRLRRGARLHGSHGQWVLNSVGWRLDVLILPLVRGKMPLLSAADGSETRLVGGFGNLIACGATSKVPVLPPPFGFRLVSYIRPLISNPAAFTAASRREGWSLARVSHGGVSMLSSFLDV